jgi:C4-dicarboxylate transporter DctM subunit
VATAILFTSFFAMLAIGVPIAFAMAGSSILAMFAIGQNAVPAVQNMLAAGTSSSLVAIPLFILAGDLMNRGGITPRLLDLAFALVGHIRGRLAQIDVVASMFFGGVSGSAVADSAAIGSALIPSMLKEGYSRGFSAALIGTAGTLGMIIPPSITMVILGIAGNISIADLFLGGFAPGFLIGLALCVYCYVYSRRKGLTRTDQFSWRRLWKAARNAAIPVLSPAIIVSGIVGGVFTPTEAGAVAVVYSLLVGAFVYRELTFKSAIEALTETSVITGFVAFLIFASASFGWVLTYERIPEFVARQLLGTTNNPFVMFLLMNAVLLVMGTFLDATPIILLTVPIFLPIAIQLGIDPVHFGVVLTINMAIAQMTPPVGAVLFATCGIARASMAEVVPPLLPFLAIMLVMLVLFTAFPAVILFVPHMFTGG